MKKFIKIVVVILILMLTALITIPYLFKKEIQETIIKEVNNTINASFSFKSVSLSLLSNFPDATIQLEETLISNYAPFENDTLVFVQNIEVKTSVANLLSRKLVLDNFAISNANIYLKTNENNISNYNIVKESKNDEITTEKNTETESNISIHIEKYSFNNINFHYLDQKSKLEVDIQNFNHHGTGVFSNQKVTLNTNSSIKKFTVASENIHYLNKARFNWKALLELDTETLKVNFKENIAHLNDLNLSFHGFIQPIETGILMDLDFDSKESKFKSLLSLIPSAYASDFENIKATGALNLIGNATGVYAENEVPKFNLILNTKNASFQYPDLPKGIDHITIDTKIENKTGDLNDTKVLVNIFNFQIDKDVFNASATLTHLISNPKVNAKLSGVMNLKNLTQAYPLELEEKLEGILKFNLNTAFSQEDVEKERYSEIKNSGSLSISNMTVSTEMLPHPISIKKSYLKFTPKNFILENFEATTAESDLSVNGTLTNLMGFVFGNKSLNGNFDVVSKNINTFDLLSTEDVISEENKNTNTTNTEPETQIKIPSKIKIIANVKASKVSYDNIHLKDLKGKIRIENQKAVFEKTTAKILGGTISLNGNVDTKPRISSFDFDMSLREVDIAKSFATVDLFSAIAPFASAINGNMSTSLDLSGQLDVDFFPEMNSLNGEGITNLEVKKVKPEESAALTQLNNSFDLIDFNKLDMKKVKTSLKFENSKVVFSPFKIASYDGTQIQMSGSHSFENKMNYNLSTDLPVHLLGKEAANLLSGLPNEEIKNMTVPLKIYIDGSVTSPKVTPDYKSALSVLSKKVLKSQKNKLIESLFKENNKEGDSTKSKGNDLEKAATKLFKSLF